MNAAKKISVIGLGYIGLPTAAVFASRGFEVIGVDINAATVATINRGDIHIIEPDLKQLVHDEVKSGNLRASLDFEPADVFIITVPTPFCDAHKKESVPQPDLSFIESVVRSIAPLLKVGDLVILESTSPVGTTEWLAKLLAELRPDLTFPQSHGDESDICIAYCPERVLPGRILEELVNNDRVIGGLSERCSMKTVSLYQGFLSGECVMTDARTAEMAKLTENSCRDVQIAFANELSLICDELDINVWELINLANRHPRIDILLPGPGVGGHCIAVDPWFIVHKSPETARLIKTARLVNKNKSEWVINKFKIEIADYLQKNSHLNAHKVTVACYGLAFKADIDDLRESPANDIASEIANYHPGPLVIVEPNIDNLPDGYSGARLVSFDEAKTLADIHILLVDHKEFKDCPPTSEAIVDTRGIW